MHVAARDDPSGRDGPNRTVKAVLGPTNTGKTHLAIERLCAHSSGAIGFPLRLLAREVYDRVVAIKGAKEVALITGEERIEPPGARWKLCTAEAMPVNRDEFSFVALDEAQIGGDRERGHIFTDRLLHARGRDETMILGSATILPLVKALIPGVDIVTRPRFSTLSHVGAQKLSRIPPRSAIVAFSAEQVYAIAEMLRRFRGGAAVVMGALSPETRNRQVALFQSGEVDYIVATDAIGMGLNLDIGHVAFAGLSKFDGQRQRRLTTAEMAQIAGRAGRHQRDGTFGTLAGTNGIAKNGTSKDAEFTDEEVYAIEEHRFAPLTRLYWRDAEPRTDSIEQLIRDLETPPDRAELVLAPEAIDLAVLKRLAEDSAIHGTVRGRRAVTRFWDVCRLPDFRQQGVDMHARFVARLWQDLRGDQPGGGHLGADYVAQAIAHLDHTTGDIDTLQGRIAAVRSWSYITQRPDWVLAREEMAARARGVEARLSDALHARLTERFVNRRTAVLMKKVGSDAALLPVRIADEDVFVDDEHIGALKGFRFVVDPLARASDRKLLLAAAERHLPALLAARAHELAAAIAARADTLSLHHGAVRWQDETIARLRTERSVLMPGIAADPSLDAVPGSGRAALDEALAGWLQARMQPLAPLHRLEEASRAFAAGPELRALLIRLAETGGVLARDGSGLERLDKGQRAMLCRLGVTVGALDLFVPAMLRPAAQVAWHEAVLRAPPGALPPVVPAEATRLGYRQLGTQALRVDLAERLLREVHAVRLGGARDFALDPARAVSTGLTTASYARLLRLGGFTAIVPPPLVEGLFGPPRPLLWRWRPQPRSAPPPAGAIRSGGAFADLAGMFG